MGARLSEHTLLSPLSFAYGSGSGSVIRAGPLTLNFLSGQRRALLVYFGLSAGAGKFGFSSVAFSSQPLDLRSSSRIEEL